MDPLRVYAHEKLLIRFCEKKHPRMEATGADGGGGVAAKLAEDLDAYVIGEHYQARRGSAEHLVATKALRCTATAWILTVAESFAKF